MASFDTNPWVWVRDNSGNMFLCPYDRLKHPNTLSPEDRAGCIHDASDLVSVAHVPSNAPEGRIHFAESVSPN